ncbi:MULTISPECIES: cytochrome bc1 complex diheme cytochrome c subunit [Gordonia]|uniref:Cytochrome bc1 complex cytochrome c subunit n=1 Tax=Gordonia terrae C-6 TaxID=1316928 RepID=R7Y7L1_9ACTN|nr:MULTISPECIES: cytochrome c [Gordonia]EON31669.1 ubiquinol-cytochrome c reductase cytochrome c subunit [Gordonia terrae C-6]
MSSSPPRPSDSGTEVGPDASARRSSARDAGRRAKTRRKLRRRATGTIVLLAGLVMAGVLASVLTPDPQVAVADQSNAAMIDNGRKLYETSCITCHGANLQGVPDRGPALLGVGDAAVYFQVSTGRMPAARGEAQAQRKPAKFTTEQIDQLGAYIQAEGGGPQVPRNADGTVAQESLRGESIGRGSELFRLNCASCHNFTGRGGALSSGKFAPNLDGVNEAQIYTAMLTGPQNMPKFSNRQLDPEEKKDVIAYVKYVSEAKPSGGLALGGFGPTSEGMVMWFVGVIAIVAGAMWMGSRA